MGNDALGRVNGYSKEYTALLVNSFSMGKQLSDNFWEQTKYDSQEIGGVLGLKNASDLIYDKNPKDLGLIQPPFLPNIRFAQYVPTQQLICWGSYGVDPDIFSVQNPPFYLHKSQLQDYCQQSGQSIE